MPLSSLQVLENNDKEFRELVLSGMENLGVVVDSKKNRAAKGETEISADNSITKVFVVPTQEEYSIARQSCTATKILGDEPSAPPSSKPTPRSKWLQQSNSNSTPGLQFVFGALAVACLAVFADRRLR